jgi:hypothetical protein
MRERKWPFKRKCRNYSTRKTDRRQTLHWGCVPRSTRDDPLFHEHPGGSSSA